jgi:hypothetical protein
LPGVGTITHLECRGENGANSIFGSHDEMREKLE